jgi:hypothetical protein
MKLFSYIALYSKTLSATKVKQQQNNNNDDDSNNNSRQLQADYQSGVFSILLLCRRNPSNALEYPAIKLPETSRTQTATQGDSVGSTLKWTVFIIWVMKPRMMG